MSSFTASSVLNATVAVRLSNDTVDTSSDVLKYAIAMFGVIGVGPGLVDTTLVPPTSKSTILRLPCTLPTLTP